MYHSEKFQDAALLIARVIVAVIFLYAGYVKWAMWGVAPESVGMTPGMLNLMKFLSIVEPIGAVAVLVGFLTCWASTGLAIILVGAIYVTQFYMHIGFSGATGPGWNFPLVVLASCIVLMAFGAGRWSVDAMWRKA